MIELNVLPLDTDVDLQPARPAQTQVDRHLHALSGYGKSLQNTA
jgi:hypothetical protein